ncbi:hypothetical protein [Geothrix sp. 21YS21S-4]|uniref:hypothetical protein n=1 Tax=Geothrix sp. 21YS21S-4 TaxID=3068889 RepID=UPI0027B9B8EB|nr:hypothetical protein [Geothrix sp. 21YS21S-4]
MRLDALFLTGTALAAQAPPVPAPSLPPASTAPATAPAQEERRHPRLPWEQSAPLAWQPEPGAPARETPAPPEASTGPLRAELAGDGSLRVIDGRGLVRLQAGLPGRPLRAWRDGGVPLSQPFGTWLFPMDSPLAGGLGNLQWVAPDFRPYLRGLLWLLEDGEAFLSVAHPATGRIIHLPLPPGRVFAVRFLAERLEIRADEVEKGAPRQWSLPWIALLPRLADLGPHPAPPKVGTALSPFPNG